MRLYFANLKMTVKDTNFLSFQKMVNNLQNKPRFQVARRSLSVTQF